jgi:hypothetical protein
MLLVGDIVEKTGIQPMVVSLAQVQNHMVALTLRLLSQKAVLIIILYVLKCRCPPLMVQLPLLQFHYTLAVLVNTIMVYRVLLEPKNLFLIPAKHFQH